MKQSEAFTESESDAWMLRNPHFNDPDPVCEAMAQLGIKPTSVLEIGCAGGWRLAALREKFGCDVLGIDPGKQAGIEAAERRVPVWRSTADMIPVDEVFDVVIYGFCLYLTDPEDWLQIAAEGDRVLGNGGYLIIYDFPAETGMPFARAYKHRADILSYHMHFADIWLAHPWYRTALTLVSADATVTVLCKDTSTIKVKA